MSSVITLLQRDAAHILTDGLAYDEHGIVGAIGQKCVAYPVAGYAIASIGAVASNKAIEGAFSVLFPDFDALVDGVEEFAEPIFKQFCGETRIRSSAGLFVFAGWSAKRERPEIYGLTLYEEGETDFWLHKGHAAFKLMPLRDLSQHPGIDPEVAGPVCGALFAAGYSVHHLPQRPNESMADWCERLDPALDLLLMMEFARRNPQTRFADVPPQHVVGGCALLTSVTRTGIRQEVIHRWPEDKVGALVKPLPFDAKKWKAQHPQKPAPSIVPTISDTVVPFAVSDATAGLTRQQRRTLARKMK